MSSTTTASIAAPSDSRLERRSVDDVLDVIGQLVNRPRTGARSFAGADQPGR